MSAIRRLPLMVGLAVLASSTSAGAAGIVPGQGQQIRVGSTVTGICQPQSPQRPTDLGADDNGTPYHGSYVFSQFLFVANGEAGDPVSASAWDPSIQTSFKVPPTDGVTPDSCSFGASDGRRLLDAPILKRGIYVMRVVTTTYDEHYDNSSGWVPETDDGAETTRDVVFQGVTTNPCDSPWVGISPSAAICLKEAQKKAAADASKSYTKDLGQAKESYAGLNCGSSGMSAGSDAMWHDGRETNFACAATAARRTYDEVMAQKEAALAADPPVKDFTTLARPEPADLPVPTRSQRTLSAVRALLLAEQRIPDDLGALVDDVNRANGAFVAGNEQFVVEQDEAAVAAAADAHRLLVSLPRLRHAAARQLKGRARSALTRQREVSSASRAVTGLPATSAR